MQYKVDATKIRRWREERHWSQEHLADAAGIGLRTVQRIEKGEKASGESLRALAAAFNVDVMALTVDARTETAETLQRNRAKDLAALKLSFWIHLASYAFGMLVFAGIGLGEGNLLIMLWPAIGWTFGIAGHALTVVIVQLVWRHEREYNLAD